MNSLFVAGSLLFFSIKFIHSLDINQCEQEWVPTSTGEYTYRVDCSIRGFKIIPDKLPILTSELFLNGNSLTSVNDQALAGLTSLHTLDLSGNDIVSLKELSFQKNSALKKLDLSRNKLFCDWRIWWLVTFSKKLDTFSGKCFSPRPLRGRLITTLTQEDLAVDCLSVKKLTGAIADGEYSIRVFGRDNSETQISMYCHDMKTDKPKEFLTLRSGVFRNYVTVIKDKKCDYSKDQALSQKLKPIPNMNMTSYFTHARINLASLTIISDDTTFSTNKNIWFGQPGICGQHLCTRGASSIDFRGTHFQLKKNRKVVYERQCTQQCSLCEISINIELDLLDKEKEPFPACTLPLGMQNNAIPDSKVTASSFAGKHYSPYYARLNSLSYSGWCAAQQNRREYLRIDLGKEMTLTGISMQGHKDSADWVIKYKLLYSLDGTTFVRYKELGRRKILTGNQDSDTVVTHWFEPRFRAQFVQVQPVSWNDDGILEHKICMRVELYGCKNDITSYIIQQSPEQECLTLGSKLSSSLEPKYPLVKRSQCSGPDFMFTYNENKLQHAKTGLCLHVNRDSGFILTSNCSLSNLMFQKVRHARGESFLIKDLNGYCARLFENTQNRNLYSIWRICQSGGFTILQMMRKGVAAFAPEFNENKLIVHTDLFKEVKLHCGAFSDPYAIYEWSKKTPIQNGGVVVETDVSINSPNSTLVFHNITWRDRGLYFCNAWNSKGHASKEYYINIKPLQWFQLKPFNQKIIYGETARFDCVSSGIPKPNTTWLLHRDQSYENIFTSNKYRVLKNGSLLMYSVKYSDQGDYVCMSHSPGLMRNVSALLEVYVTQDFISTPVTAHVLYGNGVVFDCIAEGSPKPTTSWEVKPSNHKEILTIDEAYNQKYELLTNGSLRIMSAVISDEGEFFCVSKSPGLTRNVSAMLTVYVTQRFEKKPKNQKVLYHYNATFQCESVGQPSPIVTWERNISGKKVKIVNNEKTFVSSSNTLNIFNADYEDQGKYVCVSETPRLKRKASAFLEVYVRQSFTETPTSMTLVRDNTVMFHCKSEGYPPPIIYWKLYGLHSRSLTSISENDSRKSVFPNGTLVIRHVQNKDEGTYICVSESPGLIVNASAELTVYIKPQISLSPTKSKRLVGQSVEVVCTTAGDPAPTINWYKIEGNRETILKNTDQKLVFTNLQKRDQGIYICEAKNVAGSAQEMFKLFVTAICSLDLIESGNIVPKKLIYYEQDQISVTCFKGFIQRGEKNLTCTSNGIWNNVLPYCEDIDECNSTHTGSSRNSSMQVAEGKADLCSDSSTCVNTLGSYSCECKDGYEMVDFQCRRTSPGTNPKTTIVPKTTVPPGQDYRWLQILIQKYEQQIITEQKFLLALETFSSQILSLSYSRWQIDALSELIKALDVAVMSSDKVVYHSRRNMLDNIQAFGTIVSNLLEVQLKEEWEQVNMKMNGTVRIMKYVEAFTLSKARIMKKTFFNNKDIKMSFSNLEFNIQPVVKEFKHTSLKIDMMRDGSGTEVVVPGENYQLFDDSVAVAIQYKSLHLLFPVPILILKDAYSLKISSEIFSLSFSSSKQQRLIRPILIKFTVNQKNFPDERLCAYWDFKKSNGGDWSTSGCQPVNNSLNYQVICECSHLTNFAVILPDTYKSVSNTKSNQKVIYLTFTLTAIGGAGCLIFLAFLTCMSHICCSSYIRSDRQAILCNITLVIVLGVLLFVGGVLLSNLKLVPASFNTYFCLSLMGMLQLFAAAFFGWIFAESVQLFFSTRTVIGKGNGHLKLFYFIGWGMPIGILTATGVLVYFNKFDLRSRCWMNVSFAIVIGAPPALFILATLIMYIIIAVSIRKNKELLNINIINHTRRALLCSTGLIVLHLMVLAAISAFLYFNPNTLYHHILGGIAGLEGIYLMLYHCCLDKKCFKTNSRQNSKKINSYSTKETVTYTSNGTAEGGTDSEQRYLIKSSLKRAPSESSKPPSSHSRSHQNSTEQLDWDCHFAGMYGSPTDTSTPHEMKPLLQQQPSEDQPETIYEEGLDTLAMNTTTFSSASLNRNGSLPRNTLPGKKPPRMCDMEETSVDGSCHGSIKPVKRSNSKASSIVSIETHTSGQNGQHGLPVYFPTAPPHYEMSLDGKVHSDMDVFCDSNDTSRRTSYGIDSDRMSNISSELSNILFELQAFNTDRHPSEARDKINSNTLPNRHEPGGITDLSRGQSNTFKPQRRYPKTEMQYDPPRPTYGDNHRVRLLRGRTSAEADPSDGLHGTSDSIYSSL